MVEVGEVLRGWLDGVGLRTVAARAGVDRKTSRRYATDWSLNKPIPLHHNGISASRHAQPINVAGGSRLTRFPACIGGVHQPLDSSGMSTINLEYRVRVTDRIPDSDVVREQHSPSVSRIVSGGPLKRDEAVANLVVVHPGPQTQLIVETDAWLAHLGEGVFPTAEGLVARSTDEVGSDIDVMYESECGPSPDALRLRGIRVEALESHKAAENRQPRIVGELSERRL